MPIDSLGEPFDVFRHVSQDITGHGRLRPVNGRLTDGRADGQMLQVTGCQKSCQNFDNVLTTL